MRRENKELREKIEILLAIIGTKSIKKDSHNSHNPPSEDKFKKRNNSLREKTGRNTGGQKGHKGHTLKMAECPDKTEKLKSSYCSKCGYSLKCVEQEIVSRRQVIEIPPIKVEYIEYQQYGCICPGCNNKHKASYPTEVKAPVQYGSSVMSLITYLNVFQYIPYYRTKQMLSDVFNINISEGSIQNILNKMAGRAMPIYSKILEEIKESQYAGSDETSAKVNGKKWWIWVWQNLQNTYITVSKSRGFETIKQIIGNSLPHVTLGSDRWAAQLKLNTKNKQICIAHLLRDLIFLIETEKSDWASHFQSLLYHALSLRKDADKRKLPFNQNEKSVIKLTNRLDRLLIRYIDKDEFTKTHTFQRSMLKNKNHLFTFLFDLQVPPDNNASERAIRNIKVKQKVSGQFKTGQDAFCILRSAIDTFIKRDHNILNNLQLIANLAPE